MGALGWIGVGLIVFGALWALLMWVAVTWGPAPTARGRYHEGYYAAFVLDLDGHNVEVVNHHRG